MRLSPLHYHHPVFAQGASEGVGLGGQLLVAAGADGRVARAELAEQAPVRQQFGDGRLLLGVQFIDERVPWCGSEPVGPSGRALSSP